jgi:hypothetical protein
MKTPLVSVAMVTRNVDRFLAESIDSILGQTLRDLELVIVDFGSTDKSKSIISGYSAKDGRVKFHEIPECGLSDARNASFVFSVGQYVAIMDADDIAVPDRLTRQFEFMEKHPEIGVLGGAVEWIDQTGKALLTKYFPCLDSEIRAALLSYSPFCNPTMMLRREVFAATGGFRRALAAAEDYDLWLRVAKRCELANLPHILLRYRVHPHQETQRNVRLMAVGALAARASASRGEHVVLDPLDSAEEITPTVLSALGVSEAAYQRALVSQYRGAIRYMCRAGEYCAGLKLAAEMLRSSDWDHVDRWEIADVWLASAWLYWRQREFLRSIIAIGRAILIRPVVAGRPLKRLARRIWPDPNLPHGVGLTKAK